MPFASRKSVLESLRVKTPVIPRRFKSFWRPHISSHSRRQLLCINDNKMILQLREYNKTNLTLQSRDNYLRILHYSIPDEKQSIQQQCHKLNNRKAPGSMQEPSITSQKELLIS